MNEKRFMQDVWMDLMIEVYLQLILLMEQITFCWMMVLDKKKKKLGTNSES